MKSISIRFCSSERIVLPTLGQACENSRSPNTGDPPVNVTLGGGLALEKRWGVYIVLLHWSQN